MQRLIAELAAGDVVLAEVCVGGHLVPVGKQMGERSFAVNLVRIEFDLKFQHLTISISSGMTMTS